MSFKFNVALIRIEWRALVPEKKEPYIILAGKDKDRYDKEMKVWRAKEKAEKAEKSMRDSYPSAKNTSFDCVTVLPTFARENLGADALSIRNKSTDTSLLLAEMLGGIGDRSVDVLPLQDHDSRGEFLNLTYGDYNNHPHLMYSSSDQSSNITLQQQQQRNANIFNNSVVKDHLERSFSFPYNMRNVGSAGFAQATQSAQYQNHRFPSSGSINNRDRETTPWNNPRNTLNMDNMMSTSIDLEPLPLPEDHHQQLQPNLSQSWNSQHGLQPMQHARDQQQQRIAISSNSAPCLQRLPTREAPLFSSGWGQNYSWFDKNTNTNSNRNVNMNMNMNMNTINSDMNEPIKIDGNVNQGSNEKNIMASTLVSHEFGNNPIDTAKRRYSDNRTFPVSSNNSNQQDPWKPIGLYKEDPNLPFRK